MTVPIERTWVNVPPGTPPPAGAPKWNAAVIEEWETYLRTDVEGHRTALYTAHGGLVIYVADEDTPPATPPNGLHWYRPDTDVTVKNTGTSGAPVWAAASRDPYALLAGDVVGDFIASGLLPAVPAPSTTTVSVPQGAAYIDGIRVEKATLNHVLPAGKWSYVDLDTAGNYDTLDYGQMLDSFKDTWAETTSANITQSIVAAAGDDPAHLHLVYAAGAAVGDKIREKIDTTDISGYSRLKIRIRSSIALASGALQLILDNTAEGASPVETLDIPAVPTSGVWHTLEIPYAEGTAGYNAIISLGLNMAADFGAASVDIAELWAVEDAVPTAAADSTRLFGAKTTRNVSQEVLVTVGTPINSNAYSLDVNGVAISYTSDASATAIEIADGLVAALAASVNPLVTALTVTNHANGTFTLKASAAGVAFTLVVPTGITQATVAANEAATVLAIEDLRDLDPNLTSTSLGDLTDVDDESTPATDGQALVFESSSGLWLPGTIAGGSSTLAIEEDGVEELATVERLNMSTGLDVTIVGNEATITAPGGGGTAIAFEEDGVEESTTVDRINISTGLNVAIVGNEATITADGGGGGGTLAAPITVMHIFQGANSNSYTSLPNIPAALTEWYNNGIAHRELADLTNATQARLILNMAIGTSSVPAEMRVQYATDISSPVWAYLDGVSGPSQSLQSGLGNLRRSAWVNLEAAAKADVALRVVTINGDGIVDPAFYAIAVQVK